LRQHSGVALIEALIALLVMTAGMLALLSLQAMLRSSADLARQRGDALHMAQFAMEELRSAAASGTWLLSSGPSDIHLENANTAYVLTRRIGGTLGTGYRTVNIEVAWLDRGDRRRTLSLDSMIGTADPRMSAALRLLQVGPPMRIDGQGVTSIPEAAVNLGDGISVFKPVANSSIAWIFDNRSGLVTGRCPVAPGTSATSLSAHDVQNCRGNVSGLIVSGYVAFSWSSPPDADTPTGMPISFAVDVMPLRGSPPNPEHECFDDAPQRSGTLARANYRCLVFAKGQPLSSWGGTVVLTEVPLAGPLAVKVCRYSADHNGNGRIDNLEHPADYDSVTTSPANQNFLVVRGVQACPPGHAADPASGHFANTRTEQLQPPVPAPLTQ
ncbi:MAG: hypothetical protein JO370_02140, partial [Paucibacter sp.]|nr:hypothetical protein [Roseateles sp.]